jgi:type II secretory ATPase GspE/PulE/Tfp pilus assembly ATPase PilB-like protein
MDNDVRKCVSQDGSLNDLRECAVTSGMKSMLDDGIEKAAQGITTLEEVLRVIPVTS